ncbi:uncharacterized protein LACBIDRAFT_311169 [Laccaria bicolor S238N-H82]|uniref:Predicted protein n=1 Tax=Laccaria bicolor (strain S238N-H82 / ATCC MYA-4686) TaxID=486041 RepID=B0CZD8_LACBS|nr:uncharacterized protein LACBIDRAFT_311169 [Laccaria bicolor S238N-H82]EDR12604.1 predicted protein [Laccaria bicolor S238N-H82]|eukprot:XP_001876868.1 predicted protein [Laccaria bicolor S238N-H82]
MSQCLEPEAGLFNLLGDLLTNSTLFVTDVSCFSISDHNAVAFRCLECRIRHDDRRACPRWT